MQRHVTSIRDLVDFQVLMILLMILMPLILQVGIFMVTLGTIHLNILTQQEKLQMLRLPLMKKIKQELLGFRQRLEYGLKIRKLVKPI